LNEPVVLSDGDISVGVVGKHHTFGIDDSPDNYKLPTECDDIKVNYWIQLVHGMIVPDKMPFCDYTLVDDLPVDSIGDIMLCGHYHPGFEQTRTTSTGRKISIYNPGSLMRKEHTDRSPKIYLITLDNFGYEIRSINVPHIRDVFVETSTTFSEDERSARMAAFLSDLKKHVELSLGGDIKEVIRSVGKQQGKSQEVINYLLTLIHDIEASEYK